MKTKRIAVFGYNRLSFELIRNLDLKQHNVLVIDSDVSRVEQAIENGFDARALDYRSDEDLLAIGIGKTVDMLFSFLPEDSENVFLTISARALDQSLIIISIIEDPDSADKLLAAGANKIINPFEISARKIYQLVKKPDLSTVLEQTVFGRHDLHIAEIIIPEGSWLDQMMVSELRINEQNNLILIGVVDKELGDDLYFSLGEKQHKLDPGDILVVLGPDRSIRAFKKAIERV
jgi:voltage-gated potassium channel